MSNELLTVSIDGKFGLAYSNLEVIVEEDGRWVYEVHYKDRVERIECFRVKTELYNYTLKFPA